MRELRLAWRLAVGAVILSVSALLFLLGLPLRALSPRRHAPYRRWVFGWSCRRLLGLLNARLEVSGPRPEIGGGDGVVAELEGEDAFDVWQETALRVLQLWV